MYEDMAQRDRNMNNVCNSIVEALEGEKFPFTVNVFYETNRAGINIRLSTPTAPIPSLGGICGKYQHSFSILVKAYNHNVPADVPPLVMLYSSWKSVIINLPADGQFYYDELGVMGHELYWGRNSPYSLSFANGFSLEGKFGKYALIKSYNGLNDMRNAPLPSLQSWEEAVQELVHQYKVFIESAIHNTTYPTCTVDAVLRLIESNLTDQFAYHDWQIKDWDEYCAYVAQRKVDIIADCNKRGVIPPLHGYKYLNSYNLPLYSYEDLGTGE